MNRHDYNNEEIFVGLDVHKKKYAVCVVHQHRVIKSATIAGSGEAVVHFLQKFFPGARVKTAYEAGFCGFSLHRYLVKHGIDSSVIHAAHIEVSSRDRVKTDRRDAEKIATQLAAGRLRGIHVPSIDREDFRALTRLRESIVSKKTRVGLQIKSQLRLQGILDPQVDTRVCANWINWVLSLQFNKYLTFTIQTMVAEWRMFDQMLKQVTAKMREQAASEEHLETVYRSTPGIGPVAARYLCNELGDMSQFTNEKALFSHSGMTPSEFSSGEHRRQGHISRQGNPIIRKLLTQAAWIAIRIDVNLLAIYDRLRARVGGKRAIVAIARRLLGHMRACLRKGEPYQVVRLPRKSQIANTL